jgi:predicted nucleic acid-binding protein
VSGPTRVVFDSAVVVDAVRGTTATSRTLLRAISDQRLIPVVSAGLLLQYQAALLDPRLRREVRWSERRMLRLLAVLAREVHAVEAEGPAELPSTNPGVARLLDAAVRGYAAAVITKRLRTLRGRAPRCGVRLLSPAEAVEACESSRQR